MKIKQLSLIFIASLAVTLTASAQVKKPISKVPFLITKPGNYYLAKDLVVTKKDPKIGDIGIRIDTPNVTIDLNGRELSSTLGSGLGIDSGKDVSNVRIYNGTVRGFAIGISLGGDGPLTVEDVSVLESKSFGIWLTAYHSTVRRCVVRDTGGAGGGNMVIQGIRIDRDFGVVENCTVSGFSRDQASYAITGIFVDSSARVCHNTVTSGLNAANLTTGIHAAANNDIRENNLEYFASGLDLQLGVYRNNNAFVCTTKYTGGTDGGGNK